MVTSYCTVRRPWLSSIRHLLHRIPTQTLAAWPIRLGWTMHLASTVPGSSFFNTNDRPQGLFKERFGAKADAQIFDTSIRLAVLSAAGLTPAWAVEGVLARRHRFRRTRSRHERRACLQQAFLSPPLKARSKALSGALSPPASSFPSINCPPHFPRSAPPLLYSHARCRRGASRPGA